MPMNHQQLKQLPAYTDDVVLHASGEVLDILGEDNVLPSELRSVAEIYEQRDLDRLNSIHPTQKPDMEWPYDDQMSNAQAMMARDMAKWLEAYGYEG